MLKIPSEKFERSPSSKVTWDDIMLQNAKPSKFVLREM
jgi:hypothetical protein